MLRDDSLQAAIAGAEFEQEQAIEVVDQRRQQQRRRHGAIRARSRLSRSIARYHWQCAGLRTAGGICHDFVERTPLAQDGDVGTDGGARRFATRMIEMKLRNK